MAHPLNDKTPKLKKRRWPLVATLLACCLLLVWMVAPMFPPSVNAFFTDTTTISLDKRGRNDSRVIAMPLAMSGRSNARSTNDGGVGSGRKSVFIEVCG